MRVGAALIPAHAQAAAQHRLEIIRPALSQVAQGVSIRGSAHWLKKTKKDVPSAVTIARWLSAYLRGGVPGLAPSYKGRQRKLYGWEARAEALYDPKRKPRPYADLARQLVEEGWPDAHEHNVRRYLKARLAVRADDRRRERNRSQLETMLRSLTTEERRLVQHFRLCSAKDQNTLRKKAARLAGKSD